MKSIKIRLFKKWFLYTNSDTFEFAKSNQPQFINLPFKLVLVNWGKTRGISNKNKMVKIIDEINSKQ